VVRSLGDFAVERGFLTPDRLQEALDLQERVRVAGLNETLEEILIKKGWLSPDQIAALHALIGEGVAQVLPGYEVIEKIGAGGMGCVYKARRIGDGRIVAVKTLLPGFASKDGAVDRFLREAHLLMKLNHPNLISGLDAGYQKGVYFYVMDFVEGRSLAALIEKRGRLPWREALGIVRQAAQGLQCAAGQGVVHRDVKPGNIMISDDGGVKIADLGIAKIVRSELGPSLTSSSSIVGTPQYMSPEQAEGRVDIDPRSDIYSLGLTLFAAVTGHPPFRSDSHIQTIQRRLNEDVPVEELDDAPEGLRTVVRVMCARSRAERHSTWEELIRDLQDVEQGRPIDHHGVSVPVDRTTGILGRLAVAHGFVTEEQLHKAVQVQERLAKAGTRKLLGAVLVDEGFLRRMDLRRLMALQSFHERRGSDKELADRVVAETIVPYRVVQEALKEQKEMFEREGYSLPLDQILFRRGRIDESQRRAILRLQVRLASAEGLPDSLAGVRECPHCVETIPSDCRQCPRCQSILDTAPAPLKCPTCSMPQDHPGEHCARCGTHLSTGRLPARPGTLAAAPAKTAVRADVVKWVRAGLATVGVLVAAAILWKVVFPSDEALAAGSAHDFMRALARQDAKRACSMIQGLPPVSEREAARTLQEFQERVFGIAAPALRISRYEIEPLGVAGDTASVQVTVIFENRQTGRVGDPHRGTLYLSRTSDGWRVRY
jgi:serine/threonine-protein kinase